MALVFSLFFEQPLFSSQSYTVESWLQALNQNPQVKDIEEALVLLPHEMRSNFLLMLDSVSLQSATPDLPRVILTTKDNTLSMSFNGENSTRGAQSIEVIQYRAHQKRFEMLEIKFPLKRNWRGRVSSFIHNPPICSSCHLKDARPLWSQGNVIERALGSRNLAQTEIILPFLNTLYQRSRYRTLVWNAEPSLEKIHDTFKTRNESFFLNLMKLNEERLLRKIQDSKSYPLIESMTYWRRVCFNDVLKLKETQEMVSNTLESFSKSSNLRQLIEFRSIETIKSERSLFRLENLFNFLGLESRDLTIEPPTRLKLFRPQGLSSYWRKSESSFEVVFDAIYSLASTRVLKKYKDSALFQGITGPCKVATKDLERWID